MAIDVYENLHARKQNINIREACGMASDVYENLHARDKHNIREACGMAAEVYENLHFSANMQYTIHNQIKHIREACGMAYEVYENLRFMKRLVSATGLIQTALCVLCQATRMRCSLTDAR